MGFKKGDRVLVEARVEHPKNKDGDVGISWPDERLGTFVGARYAEAIHAHPGVPVEDLVEELEAITGWYDYLVDQSGRGEPLLTTLYTRDFPDVVRHKELRAAREAAGKPKLKEGDSIWIKGTVLSGAPYTDGSLAVGAGNMMPQFITNQQLRVHPDDIRTEEP